MHDTPVAPRPASGFAQQARPLRDLGWQREDGCTTQEGRIFHGILRLGVIHLRKNRYQYQYKEMHAEKSIDTCTRFDLPPCARSSSAPPSHLFLSSFLPEHACC